MRIRCGACAAGDQERHRHEPAEQEGSQRGDDDVRPAEPAKQHPEQAGEFGVAEAHAAPGSDEHEDEEQGEHRCSGLDGSKQRRPAVGRERTGAEQHGEHGVCRQLDRVGQPVHVQVDRREDHHDPGGDDVDDGDDDDRPGVTAHQVTP